MAKKGKKTIDKIKGGWRCHSTNLDPDLVVWRYETCPIPSIKKALMIEREALGKSVYGINFMYVRGLSGADEIACALWMLYSKVPNDRLLSSENKDLIFEWIRETI